MIWSRCTSLLLALLPAIYSIPHALAAPTDGSESTQIIYYFFSCLTSRKCVSVPSAASFYVPRLPDLHQDEDHPLHIYAGHIESEPHTSKATNVSAHLYFVLVKARRTADKERIMFWFNVRTPILP